MNIGKAENQFPQGQSPMFTASVTARLKARRLQDRLINPPTSNSSWHHLLVVSVLLCAALLLSARVDAQTPAASPLTDAQVRQKADDLLRQMTLEEKVAQLSQLPGFPIAEFRETMPGQTSKA